MKGRLLRRRHLRWERAPTPIASTPRSGRNSSKTNTLASGDRIPASPVMVDNGAGTISVAA
jgi:hypothetical protein